MNDLNHVVLIGRLTQDAELKYTQSGYAISNFSIAVNRSRKNGEQWEEEANFFEVSLFGKSAENLKPYLVKGKQIAIDGELKKDRWESEGQKRSKVSILAHNIQLVGGNNNSQQTQGDYQPSTPQTTKAPTQQNYVPSQNYEGDAGFPDDIPF